MERTTKRTRANKNNISGSSLYYYALTQAIKNYSGKLALEMWKNLEDTN